MRIVCSSESSRIVCEEKRSDKIKRTEIWEMLEEWKMVHGELCKEFV